jgi:hypothetical protein
MSDFRALLAKSNKGLDCPCCGRYAKVYRRTMTSAIARLLIWMYNKSGDATPWIHLNSAEGIGTLHRGDHAKLRFWGLVEAKPIEESDGEKRCAGYWRITEKGKKFVRNEIEVPAKIILLFNEFIGFDGNQMSIKDALGKKFSYSDLMSV